MGCGKSSVGRKLSELLCCRFMDLDTEIEERYKCTVAEIFAERGEGEFRRIEKETLKDILETSVTRPQMILALGGGAVMTGGSDEMVHEKTICVYLKASVTELVSRLSSETACRPLLAKSDLRMRILELMACRAETYERVADIIIDTDGKSVEEIAKTIIESVRTVSCPSS